MCRRRRGTNPRSMSRLQKVQVRFHDLGLPPELIAWDRRPRFPVLHAIQARILEKTLTGADATGRAQTGTGKNSGVSHHDHGAFRSSSGPRTAEEGNPPRPHPRARRGSSSSKSRRMPKSIGKYMRCKSMAVFGGMDYVKQSGCSARADRHRRGHPGRLLDFKSKGDIDLKKVRSWSLMSRPNARHGFLIPDVRRIIESTP